MRAKDDVTIKELDWSLDCSYLAILLIAEKMEPLGLRV